MPKLNEKLLDKVVEHMLKVPARADMNQWMITDEALYKHKCHTVGCIAGWTETLAPRRPKGWDKVDWKLMSTASKAKELLGLTYWQASELFYQIRWPLHFQERLKKYEAGTKGYAKVIAAMVKDFKKRVKEENDGSRILRTGSRG